MIKWCVQFIGRAKGEFFSDEKRWENVVIQ
ncbi:hypothetical protein NBG4_130011 [Candidatus Sulfobium mesophilum]|uniref:Uncharacterized protein n=1 Tax=Candidatus Sulfobium mesophilum TaxID=2016548 RepID=A0A2U3QEP9_9BACT|nr:hypothetical protein NBG4_130011 [Candidatus Sulfobium mesophilum]